MSIKNEEIIENVSEDSVIADSISTSLKIAQLEKELEAWKRIDKLQKEIVENEIKWIHNNEGRLAKV